MMDGIRIRQNDRRRLQQLALVTLHSVLLATLHGCGSATTANDQPSQPPTPKTVTKSVAVLYYHDESPYCASFREGIQAGAEERDTAIEWYEATSAEQQSKQLDEAIAKNHQAYCICPLALDSCADRVATINESKTPIVVIERPLTAESSSGIDDQIGFVASDHFHCGTVIANLAAKSIDNSGKILFISGEGFESEERRMGFEYALREEQEVEWIDLLSLHKNATESESTAAFESSEEKSESADAQPTKSEFANPSESLTSFLVENGPDGVSLVALTIDQLPELLAAKTNAGDDFSQVPVYSFGADHSTEERIQSGELNATILEDPYKMGLSSITSIVDGLEGNPIKGLISPGEHLANIDNLKDARTKHLLSSNIRK